MSRQKMRMLGFFDGPYAKERLSDYPDPAAEPPVDWRARTERAEAALVRIRQRHGPMPRYTGDPDVCRICGTFWPCADARDAGEPTDG